MYTVDNCKLPICLSIYQSMPDNDKLPAQETKLIYVQILCGVHTARQLEVGHKILTDKGFSDIPLSGRLDI